MNIVEAFTDDQVLGFAFSGDSWRAWRVILAAAFGMPLAPDDAETFRKLTNREPPSAPIRELWTIAGRRSGKTSVAAGVVIFLATLQRWTLSPGEVGTVMLLASDRDQARVAFRYTLGLLEASPILSFEVESTTADTIRLRSGIEIAVATADKAAVRGRTILGVIADETAFWGGEADEVLRAVRPGMASQPRAMLIAISSAYAMRGPLYAAYKRFYGSSDPRTLVVKATTRDLNGTITEEYIAGELARDPHAAKAEYLSIFRGDISEYLPGDLLDVAIVPNRRAIPRMDGCVYVAHCDPSGGTADSMAIAVAHKDRSRLILDRLVIAQPPFDPAKVTQEFAHVLGQYGLTSCTGDRFAPNWVASTFRQYAIDYRASSLTTSEAYAECLPLFTQHLVELLDDETLANELRGLERKPRGGGRPDQIDHGPSQHDDAAAAVCGALVAAAKLDQWAQPVSPWLVGITVNRHISGTSYDPWERDSDRSGSQLPTTDGWGRKVRYG